VTKGLTVVCFAVVAFLALPALNAFACAGEQSLPGSVSEASYSRAVECLVNQQRAASGLGALGHDRRLARAARRYSAAMVRQGFFDHVSPQGSTLSERARAAGWSGRTLGETLGWGAGTLATPAAIVQGWMNSPPHRAILLGRFSRVGLGVASGSPVGLAGAATVTGDFGG
jgi:uncharacterized protein YkwD